ncbi:MAG: DUF1080 domain-containing protein [Verrucomicrobiota bacterium]
MRPHALFSIVAMLLPVGAAIAGAPNQLTSQEIKDGWKLLFDGTSSNGWRGLATESFPDKGWRVVDGTLRHEKAGGGGDIVTTQDHLNFELSWEWKIGEAGNSGVKYNLPDPKKAVGFEFQMLDDQKHPDAARGTIHQTGALYDLIEPDPSRKARPAGEWNQSRLLVDGTHVEQWLNGAMTLSFEIGSPALLERVAKSKYAKVNGFGVKTASPILLQDHGDEVVFRDLKIRDLPSK